MIDIGENDRVLFLSIPNLGLIRDAAARARRGLVVALGDDESVRAGRHALRDRDNVMFVPASPDEIPWQDGFFSRVVDLEGRWERPERVAAEVARALGPDGVVYLGAAAREPMLAAGFREAGSDGGVLAMRR